MSKFTRIYGIPIGIMIGGGWFIRLLRYVFDGSVENTLVIIFSAFLLFGFGLSLNITRKKKQTWVKKVLISFVVLFLLLWQLKQINIPLLNSIMYFLALENVIVYLVYIYCGWSFFD